MSGGSATPRGTGAECRKFAPNIFNKSKCSSCFKQKEEHSAEALECNRATRKISKCGYLFVAPGWDFSNPLNRTKRWQRRWFVLYDDGELTYSVDEHPETVPQSRIDMTRVLEVAAAEDVTGHPYSLAVTSPDGVTFVKGTCREETRWWADVLQVYSRNKGRHKRNATFPGGQTTILQVTPTIRSNTPNPPRPRFNSCRSEPRSTTSWKSETNSHDLGNTSFVALTKNNTTKTSVTNDDGSSTNSIINGNTPSGVNCIGENGNLTNRTARDAQISPLRNSPLENGVTQSHVNSSTTSTNITLNGATQNGANVTSIITNGNNSSSTTTSQTINSSHVDIVTGNSGILVGSEKPPMGPNDGRSYRDQPASSASPPTRDKIRAEDKARRRVNQSNQSQQENDGTSSGNVENSEKLDDDACRRILLEHEREREGKLRDIAASLTQPRIRRNKSRTSEPTRDVVDAANAAHQEKFIRGDPDGCGLDISGTRYSPTSELRVDLPAEDLLNIKKGWLMKQGLNKEWNKHWFVLRGCGLMYYRDPSTEDKGIMDGVIDLNTVTAVSPVQVARNYGFQTVTWDDRGTTVLSAVTAGTRSSWMSAISRAANLPDPENPIDGGLVSCQNSQTDAKPRSPTVSIGDRERDSAVPSTPLTPRSVLFSSDEEYRTASEGGRRESGDWSEIPVSPPLSNRNGDWSLSLKTAGNWSVDGASHEWSELPPSPPLTRTALSRVKARSRSSSRTRVYKRSRSSPPNSRRSTLDSVRSEDLMMARCELNEADNDEERENDRLSSNDSGNCGLTGETNENPLIVELLESRVTMLRDQLDHDQSHPGALLVIVERQETEIERLKSQFDIARSDLSAAESEISRLGRLKVETSLREQQMDELVARNEQTRKNELEDWERAREIYGREREDLEDKLRHTESMLRDTRDRCDELNNEIASSHRNVENLKSEISSLGDKLSQGIEENERLYTRMRELEGKSGLSASRERGRSFDSLSDLTNIDLELDLSGFDKERIMEEFDELRGRFEKAVLEIRAMRKELREAHANQDALELEIFAHEQEASNVNETNQSQVRLMAARIQDLTNKLATSEKQVRSLKQKLAKSETRDKRRSLSLKGRESFQISQELEDKLNDLETKMRAIERGKCTKGPIPVVSPITKESASIAKKEKKRENRSIDRARLRRKSLDSATSSEPMKVLVRLSTLETKVTGHIAESMISDAEKDSSECSETTTSGVTVDSSSTCRVSREIVARLKKLERAVARSKRRLEKCLGSTQAEEKAEKCLREVNDILETCLDCKKIQQPGVRTVESVGLVVGKLETLLADKLMELAIKRQRLRNENKLDERAKLELVAERLAYETVLLRHIKCWLGRGCERTMLLGELVETSHLITNLRSKIYDNKPKMYQNTSYVEYLTRILADKLVAIGGGIDETVVAGQVSTNARITENYRDYLMSKKREVNEMMQNYRDTKLGELADALAAETLNLSDDDDIGKRSSIDASNDKLPEDRRIRETWSMAQETVNKELIRNEVSHVIMRYGQIYEQNIISITDRCLNFADSTSLEERMDTAQVTLRREMEYSIRELSTSYEESLRRMKNTKNTGSSSVYDSRKLLNDYADVVAQKALIDARISLLNDDSRVSETIRSNWKFETSLVSSLIKHEGVLNDLNVDDDNANDGLLDAEFAYLYQRFSDDCEDRIAGEARTKEQLRTIVESLNRLEKDVVGATEYLSERDESAEQVCRVNSPGTVISDWPDICLKCTELRERVKKLTERARNARCEHCTVLQDTIKRMSIRHNEAIDKERRDREIEMLAASGELENQRHALTSQYEQEAASLRERARKLEHRLNAMDSEHSAHVNELRAAYQRSISAELDTDAETRKRYKDEIKQLRGLCEKGLLAMENSHRRIIAEMEEKHRQELENMRIEKEQALSEETQATLAALDAMRKAHEHEVQKEIAKFKAEFIKQMQAREDIGALHKEHERSCLLFRREEMEEIKQEILSLSSKYSSKCVESAALEEKVGTLTKQVAQAQQHIMQLDARNKQLRAHLVLETNDSGINDTIQLLRGRDSEIAEQREEIHRLQQQLKHGESLRESSSPSLTSNSASLMYRTPSLSSPQRSKISNDPSISKLSLEDKKMPTQSAKSIVASTSLRKSHSEESKPVTNNFSYRLERLRSVSLPHASTNVLQTVGNAVAGKNNVRRDDIERNGLRSPLWDSLRPRIGLPHQYQGFSTPMRVRKPGIEWQENEQSEEQQWQKAHPIGPKSRYSSRLTPEPSALSVAELMRSPSVRWSGRSCRSLSSTPTPGYQNSLYPPLPAVGMVAERKKRFEL